MEELLREMDDSESDTSVVDFETDSDEEIVDFQEEQRLDFQEQEFQEEIQQNQNEQSQEQSNTTNEEVQMAVLNKYCQTNNEISEEKLNKLMNAQKQRIEKQLLEEQKHQKHRECNIMQGALILKTFLIYAHQSYQKVQQKQRNLMHNIGSSIVRKIKNKKHNDQ